MKKVTHLKEQELGDAQIVKYSFRNKDNPLFNLVNDPIAHMKEGYYTKLVLKGLGTVMSDTRMEQLTNWEFCHRANGKVLLVGLGIGLCLHNIEDKVKEGKITQVTVVEKSQDVIDLVAPYYPWVNTIIQADILEKKNIPLVSDVLWDTIYFDIWSDICTDNLDEIKLLHNRYKFKLNRDNPNCWMDSWYKELLQNKKRTEKNNVLWI